MFPKNVIHASANKAFAMSLILYRRLPHTHLSIYHEQPMIWLFIYALVIGLYDLRTRRIPNWYTIPLIVAGVIAHFPSRPDV